MSEMDTDSNTTNVIICGREVPISIKLRDGEAGNTIAILVIIWVCFGLIIANFIEEVIFIAQKFSSNYRKRKTIYVLALAPVYATCGIIGVMIPRAALLTDLVCNSYYGMAIYSKMCLVGDYLGVENIEQHKGVDVMNLATPPCCCCCLCLPKPPFNRQNYIKLLIMVYQVTLIRPLVAFLSAILWVDGQYLPGQFIADNAFPYLVAINSVSTIAAMWGLVIVQRTFKDFLAKYLIGLKFMFLQLTLVGTLLANIIIGALVSKQVIPCTRFMPSAARAQRVDNAFTVVWMLLIALIGRAAFRRYGDAYDDEIPDVVAEGVEATDETAMQKLNTPDTHLNSDGTQTQAEISDQAL